MDKLIEGFLWGEEMRRIDFYRFWDDFRESSCERGVVSYDGV